MSLSSIEFECRNSIPSIEFDLKFESALKTPISETRQPRYSNYSLILRVEPTRWNTLCTIAGERTAVTDPLSPRPCITHTCFLLYDCMPRMYVKPETTCPVPLPVHLYLYIHVARHFRPLCHSPSLSLSLTVSLSVRHPLADLSVCLSVCLCFAVVHLSLNHTPEYARYPAPARTSTTESSAGCGCSQGSSASS